MSGRRRHTLSPSLFPFLAVLICTLGTLILLLALVAQNTSDAAQQLADVAAEDLLNDPGGLTVGDIRDLVEEEEFRLGELVSFREAQTGDLEDRRDRLAHVDDHIRRIRLRLGEISQAMEQAKSDQPLQAATAEEVRDLKQELITQELVVEKLREVVQSDKPRFVIVPHQGPNGTTRRPIYLECTSRGVTIWPEGVAISMWHLEHSSADANPLDEALRAARYHAMQDYGDTIPPYPMLLVRPDGVEAYYIARAAMQDWDDQFGYEMVPAEIDLAYPTPDPNMRDRLEYAVKTASDRISQLSIASTFSGRGHTRQRSARSHLGQNQVGGNQQRGYQPGSAAVGTAPYRPRKVPSLSVSQMDRQGRQSGFRDHRMVPSRSYGSGSSGGGNQPISSEAAKRRLERQIDDTASSQVGSDSERALDQATASAMDSIVGSGVVGQPKPASESQPESGMMMPASNSSAGGDSTTQVAGNADEVRRQMAGQKPNSETRDKPGAFGSKGTSMTSMEQQVQQQSSQRMQAGSAQDAASASAPARPSQSPPQNRPPSNRRPMVNRSGSDWALPSSVALGRGNEIVRSVRLQVHADRFVLMPSVGARAEESFLIQPSGLDSASLLMATAVRDRIEHWGAAAPGARWSPRLRVDVMPGADQRFYELEKMMIGSGLPIERSRYSQADANQQEGLR